MVDSRIKFDEQYTSDEYGTTTLYFIAPKDVLNGEYPEAELAEISIEFPTGQPHGEGALVMISPTKDGEDYDWHDVRMPYEDIEELPDLARKSANGGLRKPEFYYIEKFNDILEIRGPFETKDEAWDKMLEAATDEAAAGALEHPTWTYTIKGV